MGQERYQIRKLNDLIIRGKDFKVYTKEQSQSLNQSIISNGQIRPIVLCGNYIVDGNRLAQALRKTGSTEGMCLQLGERSESERTKIYFQINNMNPSVDFIKKAETVGRLLENYTPNKISLFSQYTIDEIKNMSKLLNFDWDNFSKQNEVADESQINLF